MKPEHFTLLVIDCQNDFTNANGTMYVPSCDNAVPNICKFIKDNAESIDKIVLSKDNHSKKHCSFIGHGGGWPAHCVEGTWGNEIDKRLLNAIKESNLDYHILNKGESDDDEEYSASMYSTYIDGRFVLRTITDSRVVPSENIIVCGVAGDYCVKETINDLAKQMPEEHLWIYLNGVANINSSVFNECLEEHFNVNLI